MTKSEACVLMHVSDSTMTRRLKAGTYKCTRKGTGVFSPIEISYSDLGLPEPQPAPETPALDAQVHQEPTAEPEPTFTPRPLSGIEAKERDDLFFAAQYKAGNATDSAGNRIDGTNERFQTKGAQSLLGPVELPPAPPVDVNSHMDKRLTGLSPDAPLSTVQGQAPAGFARDGTPLARGLSQEQYDAMMNDWRRSGGGRSESEMEIASRRAVSAINRSFPR